MKTSAQKKLLITLCALLGVVVIVAASVAGTVAYLTSSAAVSNVFTIGKVGITLTESKVNSDGTLVDGGATQVDANTYHLVNNKTYTKDPRIIVNSESENSYLFILVRNDIEKIEDTTDLDARPTIAKQLAKNGWAKYTKASTGWVYVYIGEDISANIAAENAKTEGSAFEYEAEALAANVGPGTYKLFEEFSIDEKSALDTYGAAKITLTAVAIQKAGFETDLEPAWQAVVETYPYIHTGNTP